MVRSLARETGQLIARQAQANWHWLGRPVKLVDGTTVTFPDTPMNQADYPQQSNQKPGLGVPIVRWVGFAVCGDRRGTGRGNRPLLGKTGSEHALFRDLLGSIFAGDLILADRYYCAYFVIAMLQAQGADVLFQQHQRRHTDFRKGRRLGTRNHIVAWIKPKIFPNWLTREQFDAFPDSLEVRELKVGHKVLVTTLLCAEQEPKKVLGELYISR